MKKRLLIIALIVSILSIISLGTAAYFSKTAETETIIKAGSIDCEVHEKNAAGEDSASVYYQLMPGDTVDKIVTVENTGNHPIYVRVSVTKKINDEGLNADNCLDIDFNSVDWTYSEGYYYYNSVLDAGATTEPLYTSVKVKGFEVDNKYLAKTFTIDTVAYAVQSENNGQTVWEANGWSVNE